ncbi:hypothetical protein AB0M68_31200 [Streptomyces sp. NPDC051453]
MHRVAAEVAQKLTVLIQSSEVQTGAGRQPAEVHFGGAAVRGQALRR